MASSTRRFLLNAGTADDGQPSAFGWDWFDASWAFILTRVSERTTAAALSWLTENERALRSGGSLRHAKSRRRVQMRLASRPASADERRRRRTAR